MESSILQKIGIDPAYILIGMLVLIIALFVLLFILMGNIKNRNKQIKRLLSGTQAGDLAVSYTHLTLPTIRLV